MKMKKLLTIFASLMLIMMMTACGGNSGTDDADDAAAGSSEAAAVTPAVFATQDLSDTCTVSKAGGYFEEYMAEGTSIENFSSGRDINNALKADSADFGGAYGICPVATALASGVDFKVIYIATRIQGTEGLVVREGAGIESISDLKGRKVGVTLASSGHYGLLCALGDEGMSADDIELVDLQPDAINAAWLRGDIDAAYTWNPTLINLKNNGGKVLLTVKDLAENGHSTYNFYVVRTKYAEDNPEQVVAFLKAVQKGAVLYRDDQETAIQMAADRLELDADVVKEQMSDIYPTLEEQMSDDCMGSDNAAQNLYNVAAFLQQNGQIDDAKDVDFFKSKIDTSYLEQAIKELEEEE